MDWRLFWYAVIAAIAIAVIVAGLVAAAVISGRERGAHQREIRALEERIERNRAAGRHRVSQPRAARATTPPAAGDDPPRSRPQPSSLPAARAADWYQRVPSSPRSWTDAASLAPVHVPYLGTNCDGRHAPGPCPSVPHAARSWTDAASLAPVMWTEPGRPQAAPSKHGAPATTTMPRIKLELATTAEIRRIGDEIVGRIERGEPVT